MGAVKKEMSVSRPEYLALWPTHWTGLGSENEFKWGSVRNKTTGAWIWDEADNNVAFGETHNLVRHAHCPLWYMGFDKYDFITQHLNKPDAYDIVKNIVIDHYTTFFTRYKGKFRTCDVVNEQIKDDGTYVQEGWYSVLGDDMFEIAFKAIHDADPDVLCLITDFNYETGNMNRTNTTIAVIDRLASKGIKVDGIGFQFHTTLGQNIDVMRERFRIWDNKNMKVLLSELDVKTNTGGRGTTYTPAMEQELADFYVNIFDAYEKGLRPVNRLGALTWSATDRAGDNFMNLNGQLHHPVWIDENYQPKLAYWKLVERLNRLPEVHEIYQDFELGDIGSSSFIGSSTQGTSPAVWQMISNDPDAKAHVTLDGLSMAQTQVDVFNHVVVTGSSANFTASTKTGIVHEYDSRVMHFAFRFVDGRNLFSVQAYKSGATNVWRLVKRKDGVDSILHTSDIQPVWGQIPAVDCNGSSITYFINGIQVATVIDTDFQTATKVGFKFKGHYDADKFSSFKFIKYDPK